jgi:hypothetical protein
MSGFCGLGQHSTRTLVGMGIAAVVAGAVLGLAAFVLLLAVF